MGIWEDREASPDSVQFLRGVGGKPSCAGSMGVGETGVAGLQD